MKGKAQPGDHRHEAQVPDTRRAHGQPAIDHRLDGVADQHVGADPPQQLADGQHRDHVAQRVDAGTVQRQRHEIGPQRMDLVQHFRRERRGGGARHLVAPGHQVPDEIGAKLDQGFGHCTNEKSTLQDCIAK